MRIYDGMNYIRRVFEKDISGRAPRNILNDALMLTSEVNIWVWDPPGAKASRQRIYPDYKAKRLPPPEDIWPIISLIKDGLKHTDALQIQVPQFEADDVIGTLTRRFHKTEKIFIVSNDADLRQLMTFPTVKVEAPPTKFDVPPEYIRLYKTCVGDTSDNVKGIPGFGKETWASAHHPKLLMELTKHMAGKPADIAGLNLPKRVTTWVLENPSKLSDLWAVVGLWNVPQEAIDRHTVVGTRNPIKVSEILAPFYL